MCEKYRLRSLFAEHIEKSQNSHYSVFPQCMVKIYNYFRCLLRLGFYIKPFGQQRVIKRKIYV